MKLTAHRRQLLYRSAALLFSYPDERLLADLPALGRAAATLPEPAAGLLCRVIGHLSATPLDRLAAHYVEVFDLQRHSSLHLSYYTYGDTRARGAALVRLKAVYRRAGLVLSSEELPDHLAVLLEFAALTPGRSGLRPLSSHRVGLELLSRALRATDDPYAGAVDAVLLTLPRHTRGTAATLRHLAGTGPPTETVGLESRAPVARSRGGAP